MLTSLLILGLGLLPAFLSVWGAKRGQRLAQTRLQTALRPNYRRPHPHSHPSNHLSYRPRQPEQYYLPGVGELIGDLSCRYNARSPHLRCAINPAGPCKNCFYYETREELES